MKPLIAVLLLMLLGLLACAPQTPAFNTDEVRKAMEAANTKFTDDIAKGDNASASMFYTEDATVCPPNASPMVGRQNIKGYFDSFAQMGMKVTSAKLTTVSVNGSGDYAYEIGNYVENFEMGGKPMSDVGKYVGVWKKQADGSWKGQAVAWNTNAPMPMPPAPKEMAKKKK